VNGYLVDEWDEEGFGQQIAAVLDQADRSAMATAARRTAEGKFDNDKGLARVERIILETIDRQG
jgi:glycosyltransferase involved in cell wall biosynthesis